MPFPHPTLSLRGRVGWGKTGMTSFIIRGGIMPMPVRFNEAFKPDRLLLVGGDGIAVEDFLCQPIERWLVWKSRISKGWVMAFVQNTPYAAAVTSNCTNNWIFMLVSWLIDVNSIPARQWLPSCLDLTTFA